MARVVAALERYHRTQLLPSPAHRLVGHPTLSVGRIVGGQTVNTVPDWAQIEVDRRLIPGETAEGARHDLHRYLRSQPEIDGEVRIEDPFMTSSPMETCESAAVVQAARDASMAVLGRAEVAGVPYGSDASEMVAAGIPSVVLGPGNILQAHSAEEYVEVQQVELATRIYEEIVRRLGERRRA
jgi:acetylornithine deacetylase